METELRRIIEITALFGGIALAGCSSSTTATATSDAGPDAAHAASAGCPAADAGCPAADAGCPGKEAGCPAEPAATPGDATTPPTGPAATLDAWLATGDYKAWTCEPTAHEARSPSPHGKNRICSNATLSAHGAGEFPVGSAAVKELFDAAGTTITGYAVYRKVATGQGEAWSWYEKANGAVAANGLGDNGNAKTVCVSCHAGAGSDAMHSGHDFVYTQVK